MSFSSGQTNLSAMYAGFCRAELNCTQLCWHYCWLDAPRLLYYARNYPGIMCQPLVLIQLYIRIIKQQFVLEEAEVLVVKGAI